MAVYNGKKLQFPCCYGNFGDFGSYLMLGKIIEFLPHAFSPVSNNNFVVTDHSIDWLQQQLQIIHSQKLYTCFCMSAYSKNMNLDVGISMNVI